MTRPLPDPLPNDAGRTVRSLSRCASTPSVWAASYSNGVNLDIDGGFMAVPANGQADFSKYELGD
ncbi:MAG: hypothetical protein VYA26_07040 [Actinomycetota bacterium]|nr:hypothetical protein [Actinomycetota bacterium]MED5394191.1 hypothetical protein [Actinomycetota bacterium]